MSVAGRRLDRRESEIQDLDAAVTDQKDVFGFEIAMDDASAVRSGATRSSASTARRWG
jgi:hypothetical protein